VKVNSKNRQYDGSDRDVMRFGAVPLLRRSFAYVSSRRSEFTSWPLY